MAETPVLQSQSLDDWLSYLERIHPVNIELGLERVGQVADRLQLRRLPSLVITVAGTNGKGSTCALLEAMLQAAGYRVGVYSSPHLLRYQERVRIGGQELSEPAWCQAFAAVEAARGDISLTFFEFGTLAALWLFRAHRPDVVLLEVGLGGRLDATNLVDAELAVVTSIALDHCDWLGDTREAIAREKAGIARAGKPVISGEPQPPVTLAETVRQCGARLLQVGEDFCYARRDQGWDYRGPRWQLEGLPCPVLPLANAATALAVLEQCPLVVPEAAIREGLHQARLPGRMQRLRERPQVLVDVAHNPHAAHYLASQLAQMPVHGRRLAVVGMLKDKDIRQTLAQLAGVIDAWFLTDLAGPRAARAAELAACLAQPASCHASVAEAYAAALAAATPDDVVIGFGSFYTVAGILAVETME